MQTNSSSRTLRQHVSVSALIEANDQRLSHAERRRTQVPGGADEDREQVVLGRLVLLQVVADDLLALRRNDLINVLRDAERILAGNGVLLGIDGLSGLDFVLRKKLLRAAAGDSPVAVVHPVDLGHGYLGQPQKIEVRRQNTEVRRKVGLSSQAAVSFCLLSPVFYPFVALCLWKNTSPPYG